MDDLISRSALLEKMSERNGWDEYNKGVGACHRLVDFAPAVDAESVRCGRWIRGGANDMHGFDFHCSECNKSFHLGSLATIYDVKREWIHCPNCGAKMEDKS